MKKSCTTKVAPEATAQGSSIPNYEELCIETFRAYLKDIYSKKMDLFPVDRWLQKSTLYEVCNAALELADGVLYGTDVSTNNIFRLFLPHSPRELNFQEMGEEDLCTLLQTLRFWKRYTPEESPSHLQEFFDRNEKFKTFSIRENFVTEAVRQEFERLLDNYYINNDILDSIPLPSGAAKGGNRLESDLHKMIRVLRTEPTAFDNKNELFSTLRYTDYAFLESYEHENSNELLEVPKTFGKSRIIAKEWPELYVKATPVAMALERCIPSTISDIHDSSWSTELARIGSIDNSLATIDQSAASDSISLGLANYLFQNRPDIYNDIWEVTSHSTYYKKKYVRYNVLCTMGNRVTFILLDLINCAILLAAREIYKMLTGVSYPDSVLRVYGDDVIAPPPIAELYIDIISALGFTPNLEKTCKEENFYRESCGGEFYHGYDISSTYLAREFYSPADKVGYFNAVIQLQHKFYRYPRTSAYLSRVARKIHPKVTESFPGSDYDDIWTLVPSIDMKETRCRPITLMRYKDYPYGIVKISREEIQVSLTPRERHTVVRSVAKPKCSCNECHDFHLCEALKLQRGLASLENECSPWSDRVNYVPCVRPEIILRDLWF